MGTKRAIFPGLARWDNVKLVEVWSEFKWYLAREGLTRYDELGEANQAVYTALVNEMTRRGLNLSGPYGRASR
jgi:hypothetical protein